MSKINDAFMASYGWIESEAARDEHRPAFVAGYDAGYDAARRELLPLLSACLSELDGEGVTIHRVWAALTEGEP